MGIKDARKIRDLKLKLQLAHRGIQWYIHRQTHP